MSSPTGRDSDERIPRSPTRTTHPAHTTTRRTWYGMGSMTRAEKSGFGRLLHDTTSVAADISVFGLPALLSIAGATDTRTIGAGLVAWAAMVAVAALLRGGWVAPLGSETLGWVSQRYALVPLRLLYFNAVLLGGAYGGLAVAESLGWPVGIAAAAGVGALSTLTFPTLADALYERFGG